MAETNNNLIINENLELNKNTIGFSSENFPQFSENIEKVSHKLCNFSNTYEIISSEFIMEISLQIQLGKLFLTTRALEFLSGNTVEITKNVKLTKEFAMPNSPFEKSLLKLKTDEIDFSFEKQKNTHHIKCVLTDEKYGKCEIDLTLLDGKTKDCLCVESFEVPSQFAINSHKLGMVTGGFAKFGSLFFNFSTKKNIGNFNFERSVLPKKYFQIKASGSGFDEQNTFGFTFVIDEFSTHSNGILLDDKWTEIGKISVEFNQQDLMENWKIENSQLKLDMTPFSITKFERKALFSKVTVNRIYGYFSGKFILNDKTEKKVSNIITYIDIINKI
ncbi:MAG: DUF2804 family protein [Clostridia bacterium]